MREGYKESALGEIPVDWESFTLGELGETYSGLTGKTKDNFGRGKPFISYMNIFNNSKLKNTFTEFVEIGNEETQNKVKYGDIFFTTSSETPHEVGMSSVLLHEIDEVYLNSFCFGFRLNDFKILLPEYARYVLRSASARKTISILAQGSTRFNLSKITLLKRLYLALPPLQEQQKIAEILSTVDDKIDVIDQQINETQALKKGLMQRLLTKGIGHTEFKNSPLGEIPKSWEVVKLEQYSEKITDGSHFSPTPQQNTGFYIATVKDMMNAKFNMNKCANITKNDFEDLDRNGCKPLINDVLFSKDGTIGKTFVYKENQKIVLLSSVAIIRLKKQKLNSDFVCQVLKSDIFYKQLEGLKSGSAIRRLVLKAIKEIKIPTPSIEEQYKIASILNSIDEKLEVLSDKKIHYQELKQGFMQQLLTGKIRVAV